MRFPTLSILISLLACLTCAFAQIEAYIGQITMFAGNFAPQGWALCNGQLLSINSNQALFAILSTRYGGDGVTTFGLPDLRGSFPIGPSATGPSVIPLGQKAGGGNLRSTGSSQGAISITNANQLPAHSHDATFVGTAGSTTFDSKIQISTGTTPSVAPQANGFLAQSNGGQGAANIFVSSAGSGPNKVSISGGPNTFQSTPAGTVNVGQTGAGQAIPVTLNTVVDGTPPLPPYTAVNFIICLQGYFPTQN